MVPSAIRQFLDHLRRYAPPRDGAEQTDGHLLEAFVGQRDMRALEALVRRHAPMVWGVCRRTLANHEDAEDAFQATFLVFVRRAASIRTRELLANWLYGVAHKTACKARQKAVRRFAWESQISTMPEPQAVQSQDCGFGPEQRQILDEELSRLPEKYRSAIVLCDLEGQTRREAARQLGEKAGTVASRLARGRALLARQLTRRGLGLSATSVAAVWSQQALGAVTEALLTRTIKAIDLMATGQTVPAGLLSSEARTLADGVLRYLMLRKTKTAAPWLLLTALVLGIAAAHHTLAGQGAKSTEQIAAAHHTLAGRGAKSTEQPVSVQPDPNKGGTAANALRFAEKIQLTRLDAIQNPEELARWHLQFWKEPVAARKADGVASARITELAHQTGEKWGRIFSLDAIFDPQKVHWQIRGIFELGSPSPKPAWEIDWILVIRFEPTTGGWVIVESQGPEFPRWPENKLPSSWRPVGKKDGQDSQR